LTWWTKLLYSLGLSPETLMPASARRVRLAHPQPSSNKDPKVLIRRFRRAVAGTMEIAGEMERLHVTGKTPVSAELRKALFLYKKFRAKKYDFLDALKDKAASRFENLDPPADGSSEFKRAVAARELLESSRFIEGMGWTRQALSKAVLANRIFFLEVLGERYYPAFFIDPHHQRRHLEAVSKTLGDLPGAAKWLFFSTPKGSLEGLTPVQALDKGKLQTVKAIAEQFAEA
jgi:hypothetical protein